MEKPARTARATVPDPAPNARPRSSPNLVEAGKRVTVEIPEWIFDATQNVAYDHSSDPRRSMVNRALRGMSKKLPGCCWTVDMENQDGPLSAQGCGCVLPDLTTCGVFPMVFP